MLGLHVIAQDHGAITEGARVWNGTDLGPGLDSASPCCVILPWLTFLWLGEAHTSLIEERREKGRAMDQNVLSTPGSVLGPGSP